MGTTKSRQRKVKPKTKTETKKQRTEEMKRVLSVIIGFVFVLNVHYCFAQDVSTSGTSFEVTEDIFRQLVSDREKMSNFLRQKTEFITVEMYGDIVEPVHVTEQVESNDFGDLVRQASGMILLQPVSAIPPYNVSISVSFITSNNWQLFYGNTTTKIQTDGKASLTMWYYPQSVRFSISDKVIEGAYVQNDGGQMIYEQGNVIVRPGTIGGNYIMRLKFQNESEWKPFPMTANIIKMKSASMYSAFGNVIQHGATTVVEHTSQYYDLNYTHEFTVVDGLLSSVKPATVKLNNIVYTAIGIESVDVFDLGQDLFGSENTISTMDPGTYRFRYVWPKAVYDYIRSANSNVGGGKG